MALPDAVARFEKQKESAKQDAENKRKQKEKEKQAAQAREQAEASKQQEIVNLAARLGKAGETLQQFADNPHASQAQVAASIGVTRQAVGQHLVKLEQEGVIERNGQGVVVK